MTARKCLTLAVAVDGWARAYEGLVVGEGVAVGVGRQKWGVAGGLVDKATR